MVRGSLDSGRRIASRALATVALACAILLLGAATAPAVTRYAAPGGIATPATCTSPSGPFCSIHDAAGGTGVSLADEAVIMPGNYSDTAGDLGGSNSVTQLAGNVHGLAGQPRPVITLNVDGTQSAPGAFLLNGTHALSHVEIISSAAWHNFTLAGTGLVDRVVSRNSRANGIACRHKLGLIRNSACLSTGTSSRGVGDEVITPTGNPSLGVVHVTASGDYGLRYGAASAGTLTVDVSGVIAAGTTNDVLGSVSQSTLNINLDFSNYNSTGEVENNGGTVNITTPGTANNQTAAPLLAADGFHQQPTSPTLGAGEPNNLVAGALDIDGQSREIPNDDPDIGADELAHSSSTAVNCSPGSITLGASAACTATATDTEMTGHIAPTGTVNFSSNAGGSFSSASCTLAPVNASSSSCQVIYTPGQTGTHGITAIFPTAGSHEASQGETSLGVSPAPIPLTPALIPQATGANPACAALRAKLKKAKTKRKKRNIRRKLRKLGC